MNFLLWASNVMEMNNPNNTSSINAKAELNGGKNNKPPNISPGVETALVIFICLLGGLIIYFSLHHLYGIAEDKQIIVVNSEEHFSIGRTLYETGKLAFRGYPSVFRAPGFPVFVAISLHARDGIRIAMEFLHIRFYPVYLDDLQFMVACQMMVLLIGAFIFYRLLRRWLQMIPAILFMLVYLINPLTLGMVRFISYQLVDYVLVTILLESCAYLLQKKTVSILNVFLIGLLFALACLVRPIFLTSPVLIFALFWLILRIKFKRSIVLTAVFSLTMLVAILPYSFRNLAVSGRFILISNQGPWALWANAINPGQSMGQLPEWIPDIWEPYGSKIFTQATGEEYSLINLYKYSNKLSDTYKHEFIKELSTHPQIYLRNVVKNFFLFILHEQSFFETEFWKIIPGQYIQRDIRFINLIRIIVIKYYQVITIFMIPFLLILTCRRYNPARLGIIFMVYMAASYSLPILDSRYLYPNIPILLFCFAMICDKFIFIFNRRYTRHSSFVISPIALVSAMVVSMPVVYSILLDSRLLLFLRKIVFSVVHFWI
jgi:hypothetical protein